MSELPSSMRRFQLVGLDHVQLAMPAGAEETGRAFYSGLLGLEEVPKPESLAGRGGVWFQSGPLNVHLGVEPDFHPARKAHPAILVHNLSALIQHLEQAHVDIARDVALEGFDRVHVSDPFGNRIELMERIDPDFAPTHFEINDRIQVRLRTHADAEELFQLVEANRAYLREWLPWLDSSTRLEDTRRVIESGARQIASRQGYQAVICCDGDIVGTAGFHLIDWQNRSTSIGYWLAESHQGQGIMTAACRPMIQHAFTVWRLNRSVIRCATGNTRSQAVAERLGFQREGILRRSEWLYDRYVDLYNYSLLREEWERAAG